MEETNESLLARALQVVTIQEVCSRLGLCVGTVRRWQELKSVPAQYRFDLLKLLDSEIDYSAYPSKDKDQFFTPPDLATKCWETFLAVTHIVPSEFTFIEPSAGDGSFLAVLPDDSLAFDIEPRHDKIVRQDYLEWTPTATDKPYIVFGNPPFGLRGHMALKFITHSQPFADYVAFILPQFFESDGKGAPRKRIVGLNLIYSEKLTANFHTPERTGVSVNGVFQIWSKHTVDEAYSIQSADDSIVKVYSLSDGGTVATTRNKSMLQACDAYLPSTCFGKENMRMYDSFEELPGRKGYGLVFHTDKQALIQKVKDICWGDVSFLSTNSAYNLRTSIIRAQFSGSA